MWSLTPDWYRLIRSLQYTWLQQSTFYILISVTHAHAWLKLYHNYIIPSPKQNGTITLWKYLIINQSGKWLTVLLSWISDRRSIGSVSVTVVSNSINTSSGSRYVVIGTYRFQNGFIDGLMLTPQLIERNGSCIEALVLKHPHKFTCTHVITSKISWLYYDA